MSELIYIQDDFGNQIPMLNAYGNFSVHVLMLYAEDKLSEADRKTVNAYAAMDEMAKDALEGYALSANPSKTRFHLGQLNAEIQKRSGAAMVTAIPKEKSNFDFRKLAAAVVLLVAIGGATFFGAKYFSNYELADNTTLETVSEEDSSSKSESGSAVELPLEESETRIENESAELEDSEAQNLETEPVVEALSKAADTRNADNAGQAELAAAKAKEKQAEKPQTPPAVKASDKEAALADALTGNAGTKKDAKSGAVTSTVATNQAAQQMREETVGASRDADEMAMTAPQQNRLAAEQSHKSSVENEKRAQKPATSELSREATYPGGDILMYKFIEKKKVYSDVMLAQNLTGSITVSFDIEPDGGVSNTQIKSGVNGLLNEDALRVVRSMPKWKPALDASGKSVKSSKTVVIKYGN
jgi:outer membrane biosynthesis protein TonB